MKKALATLLLIAMLFTATVSMASESVTYYLASYTLEGVTMSTADIGIEMSITLNEDGTAVMQMMGEESTEGSWTKKDDNTIEIDAGGDIVTGTITEDGIQLEEDGGVMLFTLEKPVYTDFGTFMACDDPAVYYGTWTCTHIGVDGIVASVESMKEDWASSFGESTEIIVNDGAVTLFGTDVGSGEVKDGKFTCDVENTVVLSMQMTDAGYMLVDMSMDGETIVSFYCLKADPQ